MKYVIRSVVAAAASAIVSLVVRAVMRKTQGRVESTDDAQAKTATATS